MLPLPDLVEVVCFAASCTALVTGVALGISRWQRHRKITFHLTVTVVAAILSILASALVVANRMYLSEHDLQVMLWILGSSSVLSVAATVVTTASTRNAFRTLAEDINMVARGEMTTTAHGIGRDFMSLSEQISDTSQRLAASRAELERLDESRRRFFAWISHDLRTPLTGIATLAEALHSGEVSLPKEYIAGIRAQANNMRLLVDDLFELSLIQAGTLHLHMERVSLADLVSDTIADVTSAAEPRGIHFLPDGLDEFDVFVDPHHVSRALTNVLANAIRYSPNDSPIHIKASSDQSGIQLEISDEGPGVDVGSLDQLFEIGWEASTARTTRQGSTNAGLGLSIVKGIMDAHGGSVTAKNRQPRGLTVQLCFKS